MINKENYNVQITLNKTDYNKLNEIVKTLSKEKEIQLTKSQALSILIKRFQINLIKNKNNVLTLQETAKYIKPIKELMKLYNSNELKEKYNICKKSLYNIKDGKTNISKNFLERLIIAFKDNKINY